MPRLMTSLAALSFALVPLAAAAQTAGAGAQADTQAGAAVTAPGPEASGGAAATPAAGEPAAGADRTGAATAQALSDAGSAMQSTMTDMPMTGDPDVDFMRGMIAHHQIAINMAHEILQHGKNDEVRQLAERIISSQQDEIITMQNWLAQNAPDVPSTPTTSQVSGGDAGAGQTGGEDKAEAGMTAFDTAPTGQGVTAGAVNSSTNAESGTITGGTVTPTQNAVTGPTE